MKAFNSIWRLLAALATLLVLPGVSQARSGPVAPAACDRHCLLQVLTDYTEAVTDNDISRLKLAGDARATANGVVTPVGKSEWWGKVKRIVFRQAFVDPATGSAVFYGTLTNGPTRDAERWWFYVVRLKVVDRQITEVEEIGYDGMLRGTSPATLHMPDRIWDTVLPESERVGRDQLFKLADLYFSAVSHEVDYHNVPWHPECQRVELGVLTVNSELQPGSCGGEFQNPRVKWPVVHRRFYIADVERGIVLALGDFTAPPEYPTNNPSTVMEVFKVQDGMLRYIEAFFHGAGKQRSSGWEPKP